MSAYYVPGINMYLSSNKCLLCTWYVPFTVLVTEDESTKQTDLVTEDESTKQTDIPAIVQAVF